MLDTAELSERLAHLRYVRGGTESDRKVHDTAQAALYQQWQRWLGSHYAAEFTPVQQAAIYAAAGDPAFDGVYEVEANYQRYATFARALLRVTAG